MRSWKKWVFPGVITIVILTLLAIYAKKDFIESSLASQTSQLLAQQYPWSSVEISGRDIKIGGVSPSTLAKEEAVALAYEVYGVRVATDNTALLEVVSPYVLKAQKQNGNITLSGSVLNVGMRKAISDAARLSNPAFEVVDELKEAGGNPETFEQLAVYGMQRLGLLKNGVVELTDTKLSISGDAATVEDFESLLASTEGNLPDGSSLDVTNVNAPVVSPYTFNAKIEGNVVSIDGFVPNKAALDDAVDSFSSSISGTSIANKLRYANGAPENFGALVDYISKVFSALSNGQAELVDNKLSISGVAKNSAGFQAITDLIATVPEGFELTSINVEPAVAETFVWQLEKSEAGLTVDGLVGSHEAGDEIIAMIKQATGIQVVTDRQKFASGEPENFHKAREFVIGQVKLLEHGVAIVKENEIIISGMVKDDDVRGLLERAMNLRVPGGYQGTLDVSVPDTVVIKGKQIKLDSSPSQEEAVLAAKQVCQNDMLDAIDGRKIQFESGKAVIKAESIAILDAVLIAVERSCEQFPLEIGGHTDSDGSNELNQKLSEARAGSVAQYLLSKGIDSNRVSTVGFGETKPIADNDTTEGKAINRRIEFKVIK